MHYNDANNHGRQVKHTNYNGRQHMTKYWSDILSSLEESPIYHNGFSLDLDDHKNKWSRHRSFLYGCDRSPEMYVLKLGIKILHLKQNEWSTKLIWKF